MTKKNPPYPSCVLHESKGPLVFIAVLIPAYIAGMYLEYFFPVYAEEQGLSTSVIGLAFTLYGLIIVYLGPAFAQIGERKLGIKSAAALASLLTGLSLLTFAITGNLIGALLAVVVLGMSDGLEKQLTTAIFLNLRLHRPWVSRQHLDISSSLAISVV